MADEIDQNKQTNEIQEAKNQANKEIERAKLSGGQEALARRYLDELRDRSTAAKEVREAHLVARDRGITAKKEEAKAVKKTLVKVLEAIKAGIISPENQSSKIVLTALAESSEGFTDTSANYLHQLVEKYYYRDITFSKSGQELTEFEKDFKKLALENPIAAEQLAQVLYSKLNDITTVTLEDFKKQLGIEINEEGKAIIPEEERRRLQVEEMRKMHEAAESQQIENPKERARMIRQGLIPVEEMTPEEVDKYKDDIVEGVRQRDFKLYLQEEDNEFLKRILFTEEFVKHVQSEKERLMKDPEFHHDEHHVLEHISEELEKEILGVIDKILTRFSETNPEKFFEQVASENFMEGIQTTLQKLGSYMDSFRRGLEDYEVKQDTGLHLYRAVGVEPIVEDVILMKDGKPKSGEKPRFRFRPLSTPDKVSLSGFASYMRLLMEEYVAEREYLHNSRAILMHPKEGDHGFYENLAHYAEKMKTPAIDEMFLLPNADLLQDALNLYDKFVEEQFASQDWRHTTDMFLNRTGMVTTHLEQEVLAALKKMYPHLAKEESKLKSALFMAVGASRGIFMNEEEKAAYADPNLNLDGSPTYASYYTNDSDPLVPLNPAHFFMRWQAERSLPMWLFLPVEGYNPLAGLKNKGSWDHRTLWDRMQKYKDSYFKGKDKMMDEPTLLDFLVDVGNVGGPGKRKGWRVQYSADGHFIYKTIDGTKEGKPTDQINALESWKAVENIGYEVAYEFLFKPFGVPGGIKHALYGGTSEVSQEKTEFFNYLYQQYFIKGSTTFNQAEVAKFLDGLTKDATKLAELKLKTGQIKRNEYDSEVEAQKSNLFFAETMARLVAKRFPSKILRVDRDRFHVEGEEGRWNQIRHKMGLSSAEFDKVMKDLLVVEAIKRREVSEKMKKNIRALAKKEGRNLNDNEIGFHRDEVREGFEFELSGAEIEKILSEEGRNYTKVEIDKVLKLYEHLEESYIGDNQQSKDFLATFAKYINPSITEEGGYTFTFGLDDTDMSLLALRGAGGRVLPRVLKDTAQVEKNVTAEITSLNDKLHAAAISGKNDFSEIVGSLKKIRDTLTDVHGPDMGQRVAHHMSLAVINFFKKDTAARSWMTSWTVTNQPHSIAAEVYGPKFSNVWEWDVGEIDKFIYALRTARVIPQIPYDPSAGAPYELKNIDLNLFGLKIPIGKEKVWRKPDMVWDENALRRDAGAQIKHKAWEAINNLLPLIALWILWQYISKAFKEFGGEKQGAH